MNDKPAIDLELVRLRARLRGYHLRDRDDGSLEVWPTDTTFATYRAGGVTPARTTGATNNEPWAIALAAPRLTLADVMANPGEGWNEHRPKDGIPDFRHACATVWLHPGNTKPHAIIHQTDCASMAAAARAVADLLIQLAEVAL